MKKTTDLVPEVSSLLDLVAVLGTGEMYDPSAVRSQCVTVQHILMQKIAAYEVRVSNTRNMLEIYTEVLNSTAESARKEIAELEKQLEILDKSLRVVICLKLTLMEVLSGSKTCGDLSQLVNGWKNDEYGPVQEQFLLELSLESTEVRNEDQ